MFSEMNIKIISCIFLQLEDIWGSQAPGWCCWLYLWLQFIAGRLSTL